MQRLTSWGPLQPPVGTGYWPSIVRLFFGAFLLFRLSEASVSLWAINEPEILPSAVVWITAAACVAAGLFTRPALLISSFLCIGSFYVFIFGLQTPSFLWFAFADRGSFGEPTHVYFIGVVLLFLAFSPCAEFYSLDSWLGRVTRGGPRRQWAIQLIIFQLSAMYFWAAVVKMNPNFLTGHSLESAWIVSAAGSLFYFHKNEYLPIFQIVGLSAIVAELSLGLLFFFPRTRKIGIIFGLAFHCIAMMVFPVRYYSFSCAAVYLLLLNSPKDESRV